MVQLALQYRVEYGDRFLLLSFKDLVSGREGTMHRICRWCGIEFDPCLLRQTFDGKHISPNTNFDDPTELLARVVLDRKQLLTEGEGQRAYELTESSREKLQTLGWVG
jgi:hypothetical protein